MITNVLQYLERQLKNNKDKIAVIDEKKALTYEDIYFGAYDLAYKIHEVQKEIINKPIVVFCDKSVMQYLAFMGIIYSGNYYVPIDVKMPVERLKIIFELLEADFVISTEAYKDILETVGFSKNIIMLDGIDYSNKQKKVNEKWFSKVIDTDPAYVLFTSGSTGVPKGVVISHRAIVDYIEWQCEKFCFNQSTILGNQAPFYFDASMPDIFSPLCAGATLNIIPESLFLLPNKLINYINANNINTLIWVPSALMNLTSKNYFESNMIMDLRLVMFCGEVMPNKHLNIWRKYYPDAKYVNLYGPTEAAYACTYYEVNREFDDDKSLPIGKPCENTDIIVLNEQNQKVAGQEPGELCIRGSSLANGYYGNKNKTQEMFVTNPLNLLYDEKIYRTGDIVKYNEYGELEYIGRKDFQIKHMGYRIELGEIETATYAMAGVKQCCALYDDTHSKIVLFCALIGNKTEKDIYDFLKKRIPKYMLPGRIQLLSQLPLNANGKIDRKKIKYEFLNVIENE